MPDASQSECGESNPDRAGPNGECYHKHLTLMEGRLPFGAGTPNRTEFSEASARRYHQTSSPGVMYFVCSRRIELRGPA